MSSGYRESFGLANNQLFGPQPDTVRLDDVEGRAMPPENLQYSKSRYQESSR